MEESGLSQLRQPIARIAGVLSAMLWLVSLALPYNVTTLTFQPPYHNYDHVPHWPGLYLLAVGWCLPYCLNIAWLANPLLLRNLWSLLRHGQPHFTGSIMTALLGISIYLPMGLLELHYGRFIGMWLAGPAVNLWFTAMVLNLLSQAICPIPMPAYLRFKIG